VRLLHCLDTLDPAYGGTVESVRQLATYLAGTDHKMEVTSLDAPGCSWADTWPVPVHTLGPHLTAYRYTSKLVPWLRSNAARFDAIVVNGVWRYPTLGVWRALACGTVPFFVIPHGMLSPWFRTAYPFKHAKKTLFWKLVERRVLRDAAAVLFTCEREKADASICFSPWNANNEVVGLGISGCQNGDRAASKKEFLDQWPMLQGKRIVLFIGRLVRQKACEVLIEAFSKSEMKSSDYQLVMAGPDNAHWRTELEALAASSGQAGRITWTGPLYGEQKWAALATAELFLCPSQFEAFPIALLEALSSAVPVLVSRNVNIWREIHKGDAGLVCDCAVESVAAALTAWAALSVEGRRAFGDRARNLFQSEFDVRISAERHIAMLREYVNQERL
jgi:glycosyltransferase involved in cell wall biosynthesis